MMKVLVVEDEKMISDAVRKILKDAGFDSDAVYDGEDGAYYAEEGDYDLIILDIMLPRLSGLSMIEKIRKAKVSTTVLMLTAKNTVPDKVAGLNGGADDYMTKPFDKEELIARVNALTRRKGEIVLNTLEFSDLVLEQDSAVLRRGGGEISLTKKELGVLKMLILNKGRTVTKESLIVNIWGDDSDTTENNVEAYISFIRKKLKYLGSGVTVKNIQGIGYRIVEGAR